MAKPRIISQVRVLVIDTFPGSKQTVEPKVISSNKRVPRTTDRVRRRGQKTVRAKIKPIEDEEQA